MGYRAEVLTKQEWPFRPCGEGVEQYDQRGGAWFIPKGTKDSRGHRVLTWVGPAQKTHMRYQKVVWITHNGPIPAGVEVALKDGDPSNLKISNLVLMDHAQNIRNALEARAHALIPAEV